MRALQWQTLQQVLRMGLNAGGAMLFGDAIATGDQYQAAVGGLLVVAQFGWWYAWEGRRK